jgi:hypothetical protein
MRTRIDALSDIHKLEELMDRVGDKTATSWEELLAD